MLRATYTALHGTILLQKGDFLALNEKTAGGFSTYEYRCTTLTVFFVMCTW